MYEFALSQTELEKLNKWLEERPKKDAYTGAIGGRLTYMFTPNNLGMTVKVKDELTGDVVDLTDYSEW